jgi:thioesterase domain-containing protein
MGEVHANVYAVTGHSVGSALGMLLAERLRQRGNADIRMVAVGTSLSFSPDMLRLISHDDSQLRLMLSSMPPLRFLGRLSVALELKPSASVVLNGEPSPEVEELSRIHVTQNIQQWKQSYPSARLLTLDASHFQLLQPAFLPQLSELFRPG